MGSCWTTLATCSFLSGHQEILQGKRSGLVECATTPGGQCAFQKDLYRLLVVATCIYEPLGFGSRLLNLSLK